MAIDVEGRVSLGKAFGLGFLQSFCEVDAIFSHASEDVIAGTIENATDALNLVSSQPAAQGANDGNTTADAAFKFQSDILRRSSFHETEAMRRQQGFIGGHHMLSPAQGVPHECPRRIDSPH